MVVAGVISVDREEVFNIVVRIGFTGHPLRMIY
jgi:hypothetical protein